jgi:hypothetical protein
VLGVFISVASPAVVLYIVLALFSIGIATVVCASLSSQQHGEHGHLCSVRSVSD